MELHFRSGDQLLKYRLNRPKKELILSSSKTGYQEKTLPWKMLFDPGKEKVQEAFTDKLSDKEFKSAIIAQMAQFGYACIFQKDDSA